MRPQILQIRSIDGTEADSSSAGSRESGSKLSLGQAYRRDRFAEGLELELANLAVRRGADGQRGFGTVRICKDLVNVDQLSTPSTTGKKTVLASERQISGPGSWMLIAACNFQNVIAAHWATSRGIIHTVRTLGPSRPVMAQRRGAVAIRMMLREPDGLSSSPGRLDSPVGTGTRVVLRSRRLRPVPELQGSVPSQSLPRQSRMSAGLL
jgi:hypothetical protein